MTLKSVDFPAPFGPINPVIDPSVISSDAPSTARMPPKCRWRSSTRIMQGRLPRPRPARAVQAGAGVRRSAEADGNRRAVLDLIDAVGAGRFAGADQLNPRGALIVDVSARGDKLKRLG